MESGPVPPFIHQVTHSCQNLLLAVRALSSAAQTTDENAVVEGIQQTASAVVRVSGLIEEAAEEHPDNASYQHLLATTQDTREHVVAYIRHIRKAFANPLDYMTRQELESTKKKVAEGVKAVIACAQDCPETTVNSSHLSAAPSTPTAEETLSSLAAVSRKLIGSLQQLGDDIEERDVGNFKTNAKSFVDSLKQWQTLFDCLAPQLGKTLVDHVDVIVEDCRKMLSLASATFSSEDNAYKDTFLQVRDKLLAEIKEVILTTTNSLRSGKSPVTTPRSGHEEHFDSSTEADQKSSENELQKSDYDLPKLDPDVADLQEVAKVEGDMQVDPESKVDDLRVSDNDVADADEDSGDDVEEPKGDAPESVEKEPGDISKTPSKTFKSPRSKKKKTSGKDRSRNKTLTRAHGKGSSSAGSSLTGSSGNKSPSTLHATSSSDKASEADLTSTSSGGISIAVSASERSGPEEVVSLEITPDKEKPEPAFPKLRIKPRKFAAPNLAVEKQKTTEKIIEVLRSNDPSFADSFDKKTSVDQQALMKLITAELTGFENIIVAAISDSTPTQPTSLAQKRTVRSASTSALEETHSEGSLTPSSTPPLNSPTTIESASTKSRPSPRHGSVSGGVHLPSTFSSKRPKKNNADDDLAGELKHYMTINDLDRMTIRMKSGGMFGKKQNKLRVLTLQGDEGNPFVGLARKFSDQSLKLICHLLSILELFEKTLDPINEGGKKSVFYHFVSTIMDVLEEATARVNSIEAEENSAVFKTIVRANEVLTNAKRIKKGELIEFDAQAIEMGYYNKHVQSSLAFSLYQSTNTVFFTSSQIITDMSSMSLTEEGIPVVLHFLAAVMFFSETLQNMANDLETLFALRDLDHSQDARCSSRNPQDWVKTVWEYEDSSPSPDLLFEPALVPELVVRWTPTSSAPVDEFTSVLVTTWPQFTTARSMVDHILARWECPSNVPKEMAALVRSRVLKALERWLISSYYMLDDSIKEDLENWLDETQNQYGNTILLKSIKTIQEALDGLEQQFFSIPPSISLVSKDSIPAWEGAAPHSLVLNMDEKLIAEQLTLIEWDIYKHIKPHELLGQAWSKEKQKCVARNVVDLLTRANYVSFWVATCILLQNRIHNRALVIQKFINIAQHLKDLNNFNTLMGIIAGLNIGSVSRLKHSFATMKKNNKSCDRTLEELQDLTNPTGAYKKLRDQMENCGKSVVPYIGVFLADLTFIDENKNFIEAKNRPGIPNGTKLINFTKQRMVHSAITKLTKYQTTSTYNSSLSRAEPVFTFLYSLPRLNDDALYAMSNELEPRGAELKSLM